MSSTLMLSLWSTLLPEVRETIIDRLLDPWSEASHTAFHVTKHQLCTLSLVCRHWANRIRPALFEQRVLRTSADVHFLLNVIRSPLSGWLAHHITHVEFEHRSIDPMPILWRALSRSLTSVKSLAVSCKTGYNDEDVPPLFPFVLRPCPSSLEQLTQLHLRRCRFSGFSVLFRMLGALSRLEEIELHRVTWKTPCEFNKPPSCTAAFQFLRYLRVGHCTQHWPFAWMFAAATTHRQYSWRVNEDNPMHTDISIMVQIMEALPQPFPGDESGIIFKRHSERNSKGTKLCIHGECL